MKKGVISVLSAVIGAAAGAGVVKKTVIGETSTLVAKDWFCIFPVESE